MGDPNMDGMMDEDPMEREQKRFEKYEDFFGGMFPKPRRENDPNRKVGKSELYGRFSPKPPPMDGMG